MTKEPIDKQSHPSGQTQLFLLRVWKTNNGVNGGWRGRIQSVMNGDTYYFDGWSMLLVQLRKLLRDESNDS